MLRENQKPGWEGENVYNSRMGVHRTVMWNYWCVGKTAWSWLRWKKNRNVNEFWLYDVTQALALLIHCVKDIFIFEWTARTISDLPFKVVTLTLIYITYKFGFVIYYRAVSYKNWKFRVHEFLWLRSKFSYQDRYLDRSNCYIRVEKVTN